MFLEMSRLLQEVVCRCCTVPTTDDVSRQKKKRKYIYQWGFTPCDTRRKSRCGGGRGRSWDWVKINVGAGTPAAISVRNSFFRTDEVFSCASPSLPPPAPVLEMGTRPDNKPRCRFFYGAAVKSIIPPFGICSRVNSVAGRMFTMDW